MMLMLADRGRIWRPTARHRGHAGADPPGPRFRQNQRVAVTDARPFPGDHRVSHPLLPKASKKSPRSSRRPMEADRRVVRRTYILNLLLGHSVVCGADGILTES